MSRVKPEDDLAALRADPAKRLRDRLSSADLAHVNIMERLKTLYVESDRDRRLKVEMESMIENVVQKLDRSRPYGARNRREGSAVAIIAESGAGKTRAMRHYLKDNPDFPNYGDPHGGCQLITVGTKAPALLRTLGMATLRGAGYRAERELGESDAWHRAHIQIQRQLILFVHYEELQRVIQQKSKNERQKIVETLAGAMTDEEWPWHLILSGLPALRALLEEEFPALDKPDTLRRRTRFVEFPPIDARADRKDLDGALKQYERIAGASLAAVREPEARARLCHAAANQLGLFFELTVGAIDVCLRARRKVVTLGDYADAYAPRTMETFDLNPFLTDRWEEIDTSLIQKKPPEQDEPPKKPGKPVRRRIKDDE